jgi:hypothetical protein
VTGVRFLLVFRDRHARVVCNNTRHEREPKRRDGAAVDVRTDVAVDWTLRDASGGESSPGGAGSRIDLGPVVMERVELLAEAEWVDGRPGAWPEGAP